MKGRDPPDETPLPAAAPAAAHNSPPVPLAQCHGARGAPFRRAAPTRPQPAGEPCLAARCPPRRKEPPPAAAGGGKNAKFERRATESRAVRRAAARLGGRGRASPQPRGCWRPSAARPSPAQRSPAQPATASPAAPR